MIRGIRNPCLLYLMKEILLMTCVHTQLDINTKKLCYINDKVSIMKCVETSIIIPFNGFGGRMSGIIFCENRI